MIETRREPSLFDLDGTNWITSKDLLKRTGISRATLNNYIKAGILPKPVVKKGGLGLKGTKQIGFFPVGVLDRLNLVARLKKDGQSMEEIVRRCQDVWPGQRQGHPGPTNPASVPSAVGPARQPHQPSSPVAGPAEPELGGATDRPPFEPSSRPVGRNDPPALTIADIGTPAFLVNHSFEIEWINDEARETIFRQKIDATVELKDRNLFKLLFGPELSGRVKNWPEVLACHLQLLRPPLTGGPGLSRLFHGITAEQRRLLEQLAVRTPATAAGTVRDRPLRLEMIDGTCRCFKIYAISFREGIFLVYLPTDRTSHDIMAILAQRERIINELRSQRMPALVSLCVLVADLQDSTKLSAELLPMEYFELINSLWGSLAEVFDNYHGIYGKHVGDGMVYYFLDKPGTNYIMDAIRCSLELREKMKEFSSRWKLRKGWGNDLHLNTGVNEGQEFFGTVRHGTTIEFSAFGDTINYAARLSDFARQGGIWTTKNVINRLDRDDLKHLRFGIRRQAGDRSFVIRDSFTRVMDVADGGHPKFTKFSDIATLPITEVMGLVDQEHLDGAGWPLP